MVFGAAAGSVRIGLWVAGKKKAVSSGPVLVVGRARGGASSEVAAAGERELTNYTLTKESLKTRKSASNHEKKQGTRREKRKKKKQKDEGRANGGDATDPMPQPEPTPSPSSQRARPSGRQSASIPAAKDHSAPRGAVRAWGRLFELVRRGGAKLTS